MVNKERLIESFIEMVQIDSQSKEEDRFAAYLKVEMEKLGIEVVEDTHSASAANVETGNVIGRFKGNKEGVQTILLCAHMDTVLPGKNIRPVIRDGIICSNGDTILGADDKSGIAAILEALKCLNEKNIPHGDIEILFTFGEEIGLLGARYLNYGLLKARSGYVLDSGGSPGTIINRGPAQDNINAVIYGKAAHAGANPETGISSIQVAARAIDRMRLSRIDEETTANIGKIYGGKATNIICDYIVLEGEARSLNESKLELQTKHMIDCLQKACDDYGAKLECKTERMYPSFYVNEKEAVVQKAKTAGARIGLNVNVKSTGGGSDIHFFNTSGICTINLATGMNKVHTTEEEISIDDLFDIARYVVAIVEEYGCSN